MTLHNNGAEVTEAGKEKNETNVNHVKMSIKRGEKHHF